MAGTYLCVILEYCLYSYLMIRYGTFLSLFSRSQNAEDRPDFTEIVDNLMVIYDETPDAVYSQVMKWRVIKR